jgi:hypothetical protein
MISHRLRADTTDHENEMKNEFLQIPRGESGALGRLGRRDDNSYVPGRGLKLTTSAATPRGPVEEFFDIAEG